MNKFSDIPKTKICFICEKKVTVMRVMSLGVPYCPESSSYDFEETIRVCNTCMKNLSYTEINKKWQEKKISGYKNANKRN